MTKYQNKILHTRSRRNAKVRPRSFPNIWNSHIGLFCPSHIFCWTQDNCICVFVYLCICVFVYLYICVFEYLYICIFGSVFARAFICNWIVDVLLRMWSNGYVSSSNSICWTVSEVKLNLHLFQGICFISIYSVMESVYGNKNSIFTASFKICSKIPRVRCAKKDFQH